ncbi:hypothetical protein FHS59_002740 [Algoriphagus iocasae]|uniref:Uncharacterized protein n=1 Tax=Algoriphagus iocasae TaxID=1836499 RepID=A0A841MG17_9BACT|nr:hypothetical protein [Algoriphagus iocasae]MBB6327112.1 hypothetical protein [Algoriphagus iocasae]
MLKEMDFDELLYKYQRELDVISTISQRLKDIGPIAINPFDDFGPHFMKNHAIMVQLVKNEIILRSTVQLELEFKIGKEVCYAD